MDIRAGLEAIADPAYRDFQAKLVPTVAPDRILGVRIPALRKFARELWRERRAEELAFLSQPLPHGTYDEMNLHAELIGHAAGSVEEAFSLLEAFLPAVDNWATSDLIRVPAFKRDLPRVLERLHTWMRATGPGTEYLVRFAVTQLMELFLDDAFEAEQLRWVAAIARPEYYVNMARAWYFSYALIKQPEATLPLFEGRQADGSTIIDAWTHNASLQKARESRRIDPELKAHLQALKVRH